MSTKSNAGLKPRRHVFDGFPSLSRVFIRGPMEAEPEDTRRRLEPCKSELIGGLAGGDDLYADGEGRFFIKRNFAATADTAIWPDLADWLAREANRYEDVLRAVVSPERGK